MKHKLRKSLTLICIGTIAAGAMTVSASQLSKNVKIMFNNIRVKVDGQYKNTNLEPFFMGDSVYVSLRDAGELTNNQISWDGVNQTVEIQTSHKPSTYEEEIAQKNAEIMQLRAQLRQLQEEEADKEEDTKQDDSKEDEKKSLKEVKEALKKEYARNYNIEWTFDLEEDDDTLILEVSYDGYYDREDFSKMSNASVENFMKSICKFIQKQYGPEMIKGKLYNDNNNETIGEFSLSKKGTYQYTKVKESKFTKKDLEEFAKELKSQYGQFPEIDFAGQYDKNNIRMKDIELTEKNDTIIYEVHTTFMSTFDYIWNALEEGWATTKLENYMDDLQEEIEDEFDVRNVEGYLYNADGKLMAEYRSGDLKLKKIK